MAFADNTFSLVGYLIGIALVGTLVVLPVAMIGLRQKNIFRRAAAPVLP